MAFFTPQNREQGKFSKFLGWLRASEPTNAASSVATSALEQARARRAREKQFEDRRRMQQERDVDAPEEVKQGSDGQLGLVSV